MAAATAAHVLMETVEEAVDALSQSPGAVRAGVGGVDDGKIQQRSLGHGP